MTRQNYQFQGNANIYLQGHDALEPVNGSTHPMTYFVGSQISRILVRDYREKPSLAALEVLDGQDEDLFADIFNEPGWVDINSTDNNVKIEIYEGFAGEGLPTLWLGVIHDGKMAVNDIGWEYLKPIGETQVAFAALVR